MALRRSSEMWTPLVLEKPGFDECPPEYTAKGVRVAATTWRTVETSSAEPTFTTHAGFSLDDKYQCRVAAV